jgi:antitoxin HicB
MTVARKYNRCMAKSPRRHSVVSGEYTYTVLFEPAEEGGYVVTCPALPGLVTEGDTLKEARAMARDAIALYLESLRDDDLPIPPDKPIRQKPIKERLTVTMKAA